MDGVLDGEGVNRSSDLSLNMGRDEDRVGTVGMESDDDEEDVVDEDEKEEQLSEK